jgi:uncharacterized protein YjbI with pentapeptide repeats
VQNAVLVSSSGVIRSAIIVDGECRNDTPSTRFARLLKNKSAQIQPNDDLSDNSTKEISEISLNNISDIGDIHCEITFEGNRLAISPSNTDANTIVICDLVTNEESTVEGISFPAIQNQMLELYIQSQREQGRLTVDLSPFDLTGIDLSHIDFSHTIINRTTFDALIKSGLDVRGATLAAGEDVTKLNLAGVALDKPMADSLISAGADFKSVLTSYLASPPGTFSHFFKADLLKQYLESKRQKDSQPIDLSTFNLNNVNFEGIDLTQTVISQENVKAIIANGGNLKGATLNSAPPLLFDENGISKSMAFQLIQAGVDRHFVLASYIASERNKNITKINIDGFDLKEIDLNKIDLRDVDLSKVRVKVKSEITNPGNSPAPKVRHEVKKQNFGFVNFDGIKRWANQLFRFEGELKVGEKKFDVTMRRGRAQVNEMPAEQGWVTKQLQRFTGTSPSTNKPIAQVSTNKTGDARRLQHILNASQVRKKEMAQMKHAALPPALQRLAPAHWIQMGNHVLNEINTKPKPNFFLIMQENFYKDIYSTASLSINYVFSKLKKVCEKEWHALVTHAMENPEWKPNGIKYGKCGSVQIDSKLSDSIQKARVRMHYYKAPTQSRLQFVVNSEAGPALYYDLAKIMDRYIETECNGNPQLSPVSYFKVFGEEQQLGRSDSTVIYLSTSLNDPRVQKFVEYINHAIGARIVSIPVIGATSMGHSYIQGVTIPDRNLQREVIGLSTSSNGGLVKNILAQAYQQAYADVLKEGIKREAIKVDVLNRLAQYYAKEMWNELGL